MNMENEGDTVELKEGEQAEPGRWAGWAERAPSQTGWLDHAQAAEWCWQGPCCQAEVLLAWRVGPWGRSSPPCDSPYWWESHSHSSAAEEGTNDSNSDPHRDVSPTPTCAGFPGNRKGQLPLGMPTLFIWPYPLLTPCELHLRTSTEAALEERARKGAGRPLCPCSRPSDTPPGCLSVVDHIHIGQGHHFLAPALISHTALVKDHIGSCKGQSSKIWTKWNS